MAKSGRWYRWILLLSGAGVVTQTGGCVAGDPFVINQFILPQIASVFADTVFFFLDNALVRLTT